MDTDTNTDTALLPIAPKGSIGRRLLTIIFGSYFVVTVLVTSVQLLAEYRNTEQRILHEIAAMQHTFGPGITDAVWRYQMEVLHGILEGIAALPVVVGVSVQDEHGLVMQAKGEVFNPRPSASPGLFDKVIQQDFPIVYTDQHGRVRHIGQWSVFTNRRLVVRQVEYGFFLILVNSVIKTLALWFIFLYVIHRWLGRPLQQLSHFVQGLRLDNLAGSNFRLHDQGRHELHLLTDAINRMVARVQHGQAALSALNATLEQRVAQRTQELEHLNHQLAALSLTDGLTGLANRRHFDAVLNAEWQRSLRQAQPLAIIMLDVDWFKPYNDRYGHQAGDACLRTVAHALQARLRRSSDLAARYGGEEFALILPGVAATAAQELARQLCEDVSALGLPHPDATYGCVTISAGVAAQVPAIDQMPDALLAAADQALYHAKNSGRNRVVLASADAK